MHTTFGLMKRAVHYALSAHEEASEFSHADIAPLQPTTSSLMCTFDMSFRIAKACSQHAAFSHDWADDDLHRSANLTHGMMQRILRRRAVYVGVALLLIVAIFFTIWFKATHAASGQ